MEHNKGLICLNNIKLAGIVLMVISLPFSESLKTISMFLILLVFLVQLYRKEIRIQMANIHYGFLILLLSALISSMFADNPVISLKGTKDVLFYTIPFFAACSITDEKHIRTILWSLYISTAIAALFGILHSFEIHRPLEIHSLGNQNYTAMFLIIVITSMISFFIFSNSETKVSKIILIILSLLTLVAAVMTAMRTSFLALLLFMAILFFRYRRSRLVNLFSLTLVGLIAASVYLYKPMLSKLFATQSLISRLYIWQHAVTLLKENPLVGIGLNHFKYTFPATYTPEAGASYFDAHSVYLQTASQLGFLGLLSLFLIMYGFIHVFTKIKATSGFEMTVKYGALGGFLVTFVGGIFDTTLHHEHAIAFTILTGLMFGLYSKRKDWANVSEGKHNNTQLEQA
jgi:O-antigen ligase